MIYLHNANRCLALALLLVLLSGMMLFGWPRAAQAADRGPHQREFRDSRYHHDRSYPSRGQVIRELPRDRRVVVHGGSRYYFSGGVWYRPQGLSFAIVVPPVGLFVPFLPPYYATIWLRGVPYYYANEIYYAHQGDGYVIVPRRSRCSSIPARVRANSSRRMIVMPATAGLWTKQASTRRSSPAACPKPRRSRSVRTIKGRWALALTAAAIR
jgi:hypothetical protein